VSVIEDEALVLDHHPFGDRHLILTVLTRHTGVQRGVLRRARGGKAPAAAAAQILSLVHIGLFQRPGAELATYRHLDLMKSSFPLARELGRSAAAAVIAELLLTFCPPSEPSNHAYRLGVSCLEALLDEVHANTVVAYAEFWILTLDGVFPSPSEAIRAVEEDGAAQLAGFRNDRVTEVSVRVLPKVSNWLDRLVREEAERPLRALQFYRQTAHDEEGNGGPEQ
jgi:recombinational DNA repair protein (RecF pathway)